LKTYLVGSTDKLPLRAKIIFGWGDLYGGGALNLVGFYYLIFLTDVMRINPAWAGIVILVSKIWDAAIDPMLGVITDRTRTRLGRRRPYFIFNIISVIVGMLVLWYPAAFPEELARFLYALAAYLFFTTVSSILMVPYLSMMPALARDYDDRTSLNAIKMAFSFGAGILAAVLPMQIVRAFPDVRTGYLVMSLCFGLFFSVPWIAISLYFREPEPPRDEERRGFSLAEFTAPLKVKSFRNLVGIYLGAFMVLDLMSSLIAYYMTYVLGRPTDTQVVLGILIVCQIASMPAVTRLASTIGKNRTAIISAAVWIASVAFIALSPADWPRFAIYIQAAITGFGVCGSLVMPWTMYADAADVGYMASGKDCAGSFSGLMTFFRQLASALALFVVGLVLQVSGYLRPEERFAEGVRSLVNQAQPAAALVAIRLLLCLAPLLLLGMVIVLAARNPLGREEQRLVRRQVDFLQGKEAEGLPPDILAALRRRLIG
jgi:Na+/melibiose symporter-like transporter